MDFQMKMNYKESLFKTIARFIAFHIVDLVSVCLKSRKSKNGQIPIPRIKKILVIDIGLLGDLLMTTPLIAGVKKCIPDAKITLVCTPWSREAVSNNQHIDKVHTYEAFWEDRGSLSRPKIKHLTSTLKLIQFFHRNKHDLVFVVSAREQPFVAFLGYLSRAEFRIGIDHGLGRGFLTHAVKDTGEHVTQLKLNLLKVICDKNLSNYDMSYNIKSESKLLAEKTVVQHFGALNRPFVCITPSTLQIEKQWNIDSWAGLINKLADEGIGVIIGGGKSDEQYARSIYKKIHNQKLCKQMAGKTSLNEFSAIMVHSLCLITVESAPMHLASALKIPCVVLFSRVYDFKKFQPQHSKSLILYKEVECAVCLKGCRNPKCMSFTVEEVLKSTLSAMARI